MLLKAGGVIFNSELITKAEFRDGDSPSPDIFLAVEASGIPGGTFKP